MKKKIHQKEKKQINNKIFLFFILFIKYIIFLIIIKYLKYKNNN